MDFKDIQKVNALNNEKQTIQRALEAFAQGGRIVAMSVGQVSTEDDPRPPMMMGVAVPTAYIEYPAQMVDAIKQSFHDRLWAIGEELGKLGITGMEPAPEPAKGRKK